MIPSYKIHQSIDCLKNRLPGLHMRRFNTGRSLVIPLPPTLFTREPNEKRGNVADFYKKELFTTPTASRVMKFGIHHDGDKGCEPLFRELRWLAADAAYMVVVSSRTICHYQVIMMRPRFNTLAQHNLKKRKKTEA